MTCLFVYGDLRSTDDSDDGHSMLAGSFYVGPAETAALYHVMEFDDGDDTFTGMMRGGDDSVSGELYEVTPDILRRLDHWEYDMFSREIVEMSDGRLAEAYVFKQSLERLTGQKLRKIEQESEQDDDD